MAKISKTEERIEYRTKRNGEKEKVIIKTPYEGDKIRFNIIITLDKEYPDFRPEGAYDENAAKDFLIETLIDYLQNNKEEVKKKINVDDFYDSPYNYLFCRLFM